jgi:hypothetical protein
MSTEGDCLVCVADLSVRCLLLRNRLCEVQRTGCAVAGGTFAVGWKSLTLLAEVIVLRRGNFDDWKCGARVARLNAGARVKVKCAMQ